MSETLIYIIIFAAILFFMHRGHGAHGGGREPCLPAGRWEDAAVIHTALIKDTGKKMNPQLMLKKKMLINIITKYIG